MKIPFTEQFLCNLYRIIQEAGEFYYKQTPMGKKEEILHPTLVELRNQYKKKKSSKQFNKLIYRLKQQDLIKIHHDGVMFTLKGRKKAIRIYWKINKAEKRTDGKMIMIIYDFPEKKRYLRDSFRETLVSLGYQELQLSVWISKKKVEKETEIAIREHNAWKYIHLFVIKEINK